MLSEPLPIASSSIYPPQDGLLHKTPTFCGRKKREECLAYYKGLEHQPGFHTCPYGFSSYRHVRDDGVIVIYTGLRVSGHAKKKELKGRLGVDDIPVLQPRSVIRMAQQWESPSKAQAKVNELEAKASKSIRFARSVVHEIRRLNGFIKAESQELSRNISSKDLEVDRIAVQNKQVAIFQSSRLISVRLDAFDFLENPERITNVRQKPIAVHKKFYKIQQSIHVDTEKKRTEVVLHGDSTLAVQGWDIFDMLPFVLLDNAIKYSPASERIEVKFIERGKSLRVVVSSIGPALLEGEIDMIEQEDYRGITAARLQPAGDGIGLALARKICEIHNIKMNIHCGSPIMKYRGYDHSKFTVELEFQSNTLVSGKDYAKSIRG